MPDSTVTIHIERNFRPGSDRYVMEKVSFGTTATVQPGDDPAKTRKRLAAQLKKEVMKYIKANCES